MPKPSSQFELTLFTVGEFEGASGVADVLHWTPEAKDAWSLRFLSEDVKHDAMHNAHTYEAHTIGVWTKDFKCAAGPIRSCM